MHDAVIRWFMVGFFILLGVWQVLTRERCGGDLVRLCDASALDERAQTRLESAYGDRLAVETTSRATTGVVCGIVSFAMALLTALGPITGQVLYAVNVLVMASLTTAAILRVRRAQLRRVASLAVRAPGVIAPAYVWAFVETTVVLPLTWLPAAPLAAGLVTAAGVAIAFLARQVATMPALLSGKDIAVENYVDSRLRCARVATLLALAVAPAYVFEVFTGSADSVALVSSLKAGASAVSLAAVTVTSVRLFAMIRRRPSQADAASW
jgi:hypothetical protein